MDLNPNELVIASYGTIRVAPVGTTLPAINTSPTASLNASFSYSLGYVTEDGVKFTTTPEIQEFKGWQSQQAVRRERTGYEAMLSFELEQWNEQNVVFAFGGGAVTSSAGNYTYRPPSSTDNLTERSLVLDWRDGTKNYRIVVPRGTVTEATETSLQRGALSTLSVGFKALAPTDGSEPWFLLTDDPAFAVGS